MCKHAHLYRSASQELSVFRPRPPSPASRPVRQYHRPIGRAHHRQPSVTTLVVLIIVVDWLVVRKITRPVKLSDEVLASLSVWSEVLMICIWSSWCPCHPIISCFTTNQIGLSSGASLHGLSWKKGVWLSVTIRQQFSYNLHISLFLSLLSL